MKVRINKIRKLKFHLRFNKDQNKFNGTEARKKNRNQVDQSPKYNMDLLKYTKETNNF